METITMMNNERKNWINILIGILVFGSIWGLFEATLGGFLNMIVFPNKGAIMSGIGVAVMGAALAIYRKPAMALSIGIVAASFKLLNVWLLFVPISAVYIVNPAMAIILESLAFAMVAALVMNKVAKNSLVGVGAGVVVGLLSATAYVYFAVYAMKAPLFERMGVSSAWGFIANQGVVQAAFLGISLPIGYLLGKKLAAGIAPMLTRRALRYSLSAATICICWAVSAVAINAGL